MVHGNGMARGLGGVGETRGRGGVGEVQERCRTSVVFAAVVVFKLGSKVFDVAPGIPVVFCPHGAGHVVEAL